MSSYCFQGIPVPKKVFWSLTKCVSLEELDEKLMDLWRSNNA